MNYELNLFIPNAKVDRERLVVHPGRLWRCETARTYLLKYDLRLLVRWTECT